MTLIELWGLITSAGPLALAGTFCIVWYLERDRANIERAINKELTERVVAAIVTATTAIKELTDKVILLTTVKD